MPLLQVIAPQDALNKTKQDQLMQRLSNALLTAEGAPLDSAGAQSLIWAYYHEVPEGCLYIGGEKAQQAPFRIAITTPEGALAQANKETLVTEIGRIVDDIVGVYEGKLNHWSMFNEINEGSWAGGGQVFPLTAIQAAMNIKAA